MNSKFVLFLLLSLVCGVISYISLSNIFVSLGIIAVYLIVSIVLINPLIKQYEIKSKRYHENYHFINNFIIALSIKKSIKGALESTLGSMPSEFNEMIEGIENMNDHEKINYLSTYFTFYSYRLFLQIIDFWEEEGGDILEMSKFLLDDIRHEEEYISKSSTLFTRKVGELISMWGICLLILVVLRFSLKEFYLNIQTQPLFLIAICALFAFLLFTIYLLIYKGTSLKIKGVRKNEKIS